MKIAWIGTGVMGSPMARHLANAGYEVSCYNRSYEKALALEPLVKACESIEAVVSNADVVFSIVGYPKDVEEVYAEVFKYAKKGTILVDMTTSSPLLAQTLEVKAKKLGLHMLDAPVTGGDKGALEATLSIMVGGEEAVFGKIRELFDVLGKTITYTGKSGSGQHMKLANQIAIAGTLLGTVEAIKYALDQKLDLAGFYKVLSGGSAESWQFVNNGKKILNADYEPGFYIKHFLKDLNLAIDASKIPLEGTLLVRDMLVALTEKGFEDLGTQALILYYLDNQVYGQFI